MATPSAPNLSTVSTGFTTGPIQTGSVKDMAYGGNSPAQIVSAQQGVLARVTRSTPKLRRGRMLPTVPRTKAETLYVRDPGQTLQNVTLNTGAVGIGASGVQTPGTIAAASSTGAVSRYRTPGISTVQP